MSIPNEPHYHCLIDPSDNSIISQGETDLKECSPFEFGDRLIEQWGIVKLPSMGNHETRTLDYFYATNLIRPSRSLAKFTKGPFVVVRSVMGSSDPGHEEHIPYQYGYEDCKPVRYDEFPLPENPPAYLAKENFYDLDAIELALKDCIAELKSAVSSNFTSEATDRLLSKAEALAVSTGGNGLHPHPNSFSRPSEEESAIMILDLVLFAILEANSATLPHDVIRDHKERRRIYDFSDSQLRYVLAEQQKSSK